MYINGVLENRTNKAKPTTLIYKIASVSNSVVIRMNHQGISLSLFLAVVLTTRFMSMTNSNKIP